jgi:5-methylcytosine-specific restriction endonuclease McrA
MSNRRVALILRDGDRCHICGLRMHFSLNGPDDGKLDDPLAMTRDHVRPLASGVKKPNQLRNLRLAHLYCNRLRGHQTVTKELRVQCRAAILKIIKERGF